MKFECVCGKTIEFSGKHNSYNIGEAQHETGWYFVLLSGGGNTWLCQECQPKVFDLVAQMTDIFGQEKIKYLYLPQFVSER